MSVTWVEGFGGLVMKRKIFVLCAVGAIVLGLPGTGFSLAAPESNGDNQQIDIKEFVHQIFIHGVPYEEAVKYGPEVVPTLLAMLADPADEQQWPNIVVVLGMLGDDRAVDPMIAFIGKDAEGALSDAHYRAKTNAVMSMGYLINKTGNAKALAYLKESVDTKAWAERKVGWTSPYHAATSERDLRLTKMAILGLALSGHPAAAETLRSLQQPAATEAGKKFQAQVSDLVSEALNAHKAIAKEGLAGYYRKSKPE